MPYTYRFASNASYRYAPGSLFLGLDPAEGYEVGVKTERHAITIAGAGAGKGAALMIPNLLRWPGNALVIDPKGEAVQNTAEARAAMGQEVRVLDPFNEITAPHLQRFKAYFNPLSEIDTAAIDAPEDIGVIVDGLLLRHDPRAGHWDGGGTTVMAGMIAQVLSEAPPGRRTLPEMRKLLTLPPNEFAALITRMTTNGAIGGLPAAAATKLTKSGSEAGHFLSVADENTKWLDSPAISAVMSESTFNLSDLKTRPCTVYLVLPAHRIGVHGRFLRLFVRAALNAMAQGGKEGRRCLFLLDEFYALGHIDEVAKASGLMRGYGVSLWPIMQSMGQLEELYGRQMAGDFFANADAHVFFGNTDGPTLAYISRQIGEVSASEIEAPPAKDDYTPSFTATMLKMQEQEQREWSVREENKMRSYQYESAGVGRPRLSSSDIRGIVMKGDADTVARSMIVFAKGSDVLNVKLAPYFVTAPPVHRAPIAPPVRAHSGNPIEGADYWPGFWGFWTGFGIIGGGGLVFLLDWLALITSHSAIIGIMFGAAAGGALLWHISWKDLNS